MKTNPYAELLKALQATSKTDSDGMTVREIAKALGCQHDAARDRLRAAIDAGKVICSGRKTSRRIDGVAGTVPAYRLVNGAK